MEIKKYLLVGLMLLVGTMAFAQKEPNMDIHCEIACMEGKHHEGLFLGTQRSVVPDIYDLKYHELYFEVDPGVEFITGRITSNFIVTGAGVDTIVFDLINSLIVDSVKIIGLSSTFSDLPNDGL